MDAWVRLQQYEKLYQSFREEYHILINVCVQWNLVPWLACLWTIGYSILGEKEHFGGVIKTEFWAISSFMVVLILIVGNGWHLNETLENLEKLIWSKFEESRDREEKNVQIMLLGYINKHPIHFTFAGMRITKRSTFFAICGFIVSKAAAKLVTMLY